MPFFIFKCLSIRYIIPRRVEIRLSLFILIPYPVLGYAADTPCLPLPCNAYNEEINNITKKLKTKFSFPPVPFIRYLGCPVQREEALEEDGD